MPETRPAHTRFHVGPCPKSTNIGDIAIDYTVHASEGGIVSMCTIYLSWEEAAQLRNDITRTLNAGPA